MEFHKALLLRGCPLIAFELWIAESAPSLATLLGVSSRDVTGDLTPTPSSMCRNYIAQQISFFHGPAVLADTRARMHVSSEVKRIRYEFRKECESYLKTTSKIQYFVFSSQFFRGV